MSFTRVNYGPLDWYFTVDGEVHKVESCQTVKTAKQVLRNRIGSLPRNIGYKSQRKGMIGYFESYYGSHNHQVHWYKNGGGFVNLM